jgi:hypothetical protein
MHVTVTAHLREDINNGPEDQEANTNISIPTLRTCMSPISSRSPKFRGAFAGVCGDPFEGRESWWETKPFNEFNIVLPTYQSGGIMRVRVDLSANHGGKFGFSICQRTGNLDQACFNQHLTRVDIPGERWFWMQTGDC